MQNRSTSARGWWAFLAASVLSALSTPIASAQLPSFNGAEGFGGTFTGTAPAGGWFSGARIYHVTTTEDDPGSDGKGAPGTLRRAFLDPAGKQQGGNVVVVFDVGGTFQLTQGSLDIKNISNYYIAGQTAPSPVVVYGDTTQLTHSPGKETSNIILRYMTFRKGAGDGEDAITFAGSGLGTNLILDHVSASWAEDEDLSVTNNNTNVTVQNSIIHDALVNNHAYGSLLRPKISSNVTLHHNLYANNASRQARFGTYNAETLTADFRNNVVYNFRDRASYAGGSSDPEQEYANVNYVRNYIIAGPGTGTVSDKYGGEYAFRVDKNITAQVYQSGNYIDADEAPNGAPSDGVLDGTDTGEDMFVVTTPVSDQSLTFVGSPFTAPSVTTQSPPDAYNQVINSVGNFWWARDVIDSRVISNVMDFTGPPLAQSSPIASELAYVTGGAYPNAPTTHPVNWDTDDDGMPDEREMKHGLNPSSSADMTLDFDNDGYVNVQEYFDEVGAFPAPAPIVFNGATNSRYAQITNWKTDDGGITAGTNWQPSRFDEAQINGGTVVVDAVGQHAGLLKIGSNAGNNATLSVTGGWLQVEEQVVIGADPAATATLSLSGGVLDTPELSKGVGGAFNFTGGTLHADTVNFSLVNDGGTLSPGHSIGQTHVAGDLALNGGALAIELASSGLGDTLVVDGNAILGGALDVSLLDSFSPTLGDNWQILSAGGISGMFSSVTDGYSVQKQGDNLLLYFGPAPPLALAGDYNGDHVVDAADYTVWRNHLGESFALTNETESLGTVDQADYEAWKTNFGATSAGSGGGSIGAVPEPSSGILIAIVFAIMTAAPRRVPCE